jgi:hypothetical protein
MSDPNRCTSLKVIIQWAVGMLPLECLKHSSIDQA